MHIVEVWNWNGKETGKTFDVENVESFKIERRKALAQWGPCAGLPYTPERAKGLGYIMPNGDRWTAIESL